MSEVAEVAAEVTETPAAVVDDQNTEQVVEGSESTPESTEAETTKPPETEEQRRSKYQRRIDRKNSEIAAARTEARMRKERLEQLAGSTGQRRTYPGQVRQLRGLHGGESRLRGREDRRRASIEGAAAGSATQGNRGAAVRHDLMAGQTTRRY